MDGHPHDVEPDVLGPIVERFIGACRGRSSGSDVPDV
jgi:hypothetical protein